MTEPVANVAPMLASLLALAAFVTVLVGVIRHFNGRGGDSRPGVSAPTPASPPTATTIVHQVFAGCGLVAMLPFALLVVGLGLPAWQRAEATGRIGPPQYVIAAAAAALYVAMFAWLVRVFRGPRPAPGPAPAREVSASGAAAAGRVAAGCGCAAAVVAGLVAFGYAMPGWLGAHPDAVGTAANAAPAAVVGFIVLLGALAGVLLTGRPGSARTTPRGPRPSGLMVWLVLPLLIAAGGGLVIASAFHDDGRFHLGAGEALILVMSVLLYLNAVVKWFRAPASAPASTQPAPNGPPSSRHRSGFTLSFPVRLALWLLVAAGLFYLGDIEANKPPPPWFTVVFPIHVGVLVLFVVISPADWEDWAQRGQAVNGLVDRNANPAPPSAPTPAPAAPRDCPSCGQRIPAGSPQGLCPRCLLKGVLPSAGGPSPTLAFAEAFVAPPVEDVAKLFPHLEVKELVGQGGMGAVYLARQTSLDRPVALKLIRPREADPTFAERFAREARALAKLTHPNVVTVHESGTAGGLPYLVMEYVDGVTLRDAMRERKLEPAAALAVVRQLCDALEYAHAQGVVHRDVKPENILLTRDGRVKIADFGLAKVADPAGVSLTGTQQAMGTPHYMAPEQWEKPTAVDHRADLYALGVVLYELLTGELPLGRFDPPSQKVRLDVRLDEIVLRALAKEPDRRYQHASDVRTDLDRIGTPAAAGGWVRTRTFREYRSKATFLGWPLVHVVAGFDPRTGLRKAAVGWIAVGDSAAVGGLAVAGGWAVGGLAIGGGGAVGLVGLAGGFALAVVAAAGGWATGAVVAAAGGMALSAGLAVAGGHALAPFAIGASAEGGHVISATHRSPDFADALRGWCSWLAERVWPF